MSCNGCRVLRKGCSDSCALRPCLQWIEGAEAQGHATVFVAKFFGRAGLMGFIAAVPENQRPALFRSLLYEACGRTVNPVYGAVGLLWSGNWHVCQAAVDTVLRGGSLKPAGSSPSNLPCYGPMPNLPRLHIKSATPSPSPSPSPPQPPAPDHHNDVKRFKALDHHHHHQSQSLVKAGGCDVGHVTLGGRSGPSDRPLLVAVKREREEAAELVAPVARRPRVSRPGLCQLEPISAVDEELIDLDLTLSSHPPTPQLFLPPRKNNATNISLTTATATAAAATTTTATPAVAIPRVASPVSCSNSFSSEGSVTSLDTADFIASNCHTVAATTSGIPGMDLLQRMERRQHHHHHHHHHHYGHHQRRELQQQ
ncbi:uncharacterized protein LOC9648216 [Selaginella moellendorffii]|nr:uncharacterized protein LOC9648216 [Selaginella moellendorffii]|eukprot:XP_002980518.2 uncharacterized protein LOC9648216 [Selaginella moellendorffii]